MLMLASMSFKFFKIMTKLLKKKKIQFNITILGAAFYVIRLHHVITLCFFLPVLNLLHIYIHIFVHSTTYILLHI